MNELDSTTSPQFTAPRLSWSAIARLIRLRNQTGTWLLLLPTMWSLVLAGQGTPPLRLVLTFAIGSFLMRSAGVVLNDLADRSFDRHVARTHTRPLASGELSPRHALLVAAVLLGLAGILVMTLNSLTALLSPIAVLLASLYPFAKRFVRMPQAMLGIAFGWGTIMAWAASRGTIEAPAWILFGATVCWAIGYDTIYALQDQEDDRRIGVKSSALFFGKWIWLAVGSTLAAMLALLGLAGWITRIGWIYYAVLGAAAILAAKQALELRAAVSATRAFELFHRHVWLGSGILAGLLAGCLL
ncbi:MAG: 4-hydroxybenzoate octaprenyltransferase [Nitrospira sp. CR1.3]|nr:4-hydroxybenzoate octaprenyltransferase [Nitrospira sp. CR1.3]